MQALKALVIIMGVLIIAGLAVVVVTIYNRIQARSQVSASAAADEGAAPAFDRATIPIPAGCRVANIAPAGDRLLMQLEGSGGCDQILIVDLQSGRLLGRLDLVPAP